MLQYTSIACIVVCTFWRKETHFHSCRHRKTTVTPVVTISPLYTSHIWALKYSGMCCCVADWAFPDVSEERQLTRTQQHVTFSYQNSQRNRRVNAKPRSKSVVHITFCSLTQRMRWAGHVARMGERRGVYMVWVWKPEDKRPLGRPRSRWEDNIKWIYRKWDVGLWTGSSWLRIGAGGGHLWMR